MYQAVHATAFASGDAAREDQHMDSTGDLGPDSAAGHGRADLPPGLPPPVDAAAAARRLAATLLAHADDLASDDLATVSGAMAAVRSGARAVEAALTARGWGGGVAPRVRLRGRGRPVGRRARGAPRRGVASDDDLDLDDLDLDGPDDADDDPWEVPAGHEADVPGALGLRRHRPRGAAAARRAARRGARAALGPGGDPRAPPALRAHRAGVLHGRDLEGAGLVFAGGQNVVHEIPLTLWELDDDARDDEFPTATP